MYYYGARYYDARRSVWLSVDPLAEIYPHITPYAYCLNNPVRNIDSDGRRVTIVGNDSNVAVDALQMRMTGLDLSLIEGELTYTENGRRLSKIDKRVKKIIDNKNVSVNLITTNKNEFKFDEKGEPFSFFGGAFLGNILSEDKNSCRANQLINIRVLLSMDRESGNSYGTSFLHELTEAYEGALISIGNGVSSPPEGYEGSVYTDAHEKASYQPEVRMFYVNSKGEKSPFPKEDSTHESYRVKRNLINGYVWNELFTLPIKRK